jgi:hypothetical protein
VTAELDGWNGPRLDDAFREVRDDIKQVQRDLQGIRDVLAVRAEQRIVEHHDQARERKRDRQWLIGAALASTGLIISAMAIFVGAIH